MTYLRIRNFWDFQNADAWKKSLASKKQDPPGWCKLYRRRDHDLDLLPVEARLLFHELLKVATETQNVIPKKSEWISSATRMTTQQVTKALPLLLEGAWLTETRSSRPSRKILEGFAKVSPSQARRSEIEKTETKTEKETREKEIKQRAVTGKRDVQPSDFTIPNLKAVNE